MCLFNDAHTNVCLLGFLEKYNYTSTYKLFSIIFSVSTLPFMLSSVHTFNQIIDQELHAVTDGWSFFLFLVPLLLGVTIHITGTSVPFNAYSISFLYNKNYGSTYP